MSSLGSSFLRTLLLSSFLLYGLPHSLQAFSGEPASTQGSIKSGGNTAKCASLNGAVLIVHTLLLFLLSYSLLSAPKLFC